MNRLGILTTIAVGGAIALGTAFAQAQQSTPTPRPGPATASPAPSTPSTAEQVETWTTKQWEAAKKEWAKDKAKWADCRKQSSTQKLKGRKSWSFLYKCMTG